MTIRRPVACAWVIDPVGGRFAGGGAGVPEPVTVNFVDISWRELPALAFTVERKDAPVTCLVPEVPTSRTVALSTRPETPIVPEIVIEVTVPTPNQLPSSAPV